MICCLRVLCKCFDNVLYKHETFNTVSGMSNYNESPTKPVAAFHRSNKHKKIKKPNSDRYRLSANISLGKLFKHSPTWKLNINPKLVNSNYRKLWKHFLCLDYSGETFWESWKSEYVLKYTTITPTKNAFHIKIYTELSDEFCYKDGFLKFLYQTQHSWRMSENALNRV